MGVQTLSWAELAVTLWLCIARGVPSRPNSSGYPSLGVPTLSIEYMPKRQSWYMKTLMNLSGKKCIMSLIYEGYEGYDVLERSIFVGVVASLSRVAGS